jgi:hypothetical protein
MTRRTDLVVHVDAVPEPGLVRPAIEAALQSRPWPPGPEAQLAEVVRTALRSAVEGATASGPATAPASAVAPRPGGEGT